MNNSTSEQDIFNIFGVMYASALFQGFVNAILMQPLVWMERTVLYRERSAGMYTSMAYTIAQVILFLQSIQNCSIFYELTIYHELKVQHKDCCIIIPWQWVW